MGQQWRRGVRFTCVWVSRQLRRGHILNEWRKAWVVSGEGWGDLKFSILGRGMIWNIGFSPKKFPRKQRGSTPLFHMLFIIFSVMQTYFNDMFNLLFKWPWIWHSLLHQVFLEAFPESGKFAQHGRRTGWPDDFQKIAQDFRQKPQVLAQIGFGA